jgi:uncharacterized protein YyaL (SSP411 family)
MNDDGDYFTWTQEEVQAVLSEEEAGVACLYYDINEVGEMHHNPAKNVLYVRAPIEEIARRLSLTPARVDELLQSAKKKMYAARLKRPTPYVDKTVYVGWNALCVSAYLEAARVLKLDSPRHFALRSLDRILSEGWQAERRLQHLIAYSDSAAEPRAVPGMLDDYAFMAVACLDAYEASADLSYFNFARSIADAMVQRFFDIESGGFFDSEVPADGKALGVLGTRRKPFQDSPTPAGNPVAAIAMVRLHAYTHDSGYREMAEQTLEVLAGSAGKYGIFAATYGIAAVYFTRPHTQLVIVGGDELAGQLAQVAATGFALNRNILRLTANEAVAQNLPPALAESIPLIPALKQGRSVAVVCADFSCQPPIFDPGELAGILANNPAEHDSKTKK